MKANFVAPARQKQAFCKFLSWKKVLHVFMHTPVGQMGYMVESTSKSLIQKAHHLQKVYTLFFGHLLASQKQLTY